MLFNLLMKYLFSLRGLFLLCFCLTLAFSFYRSSIWHFTLETNFWSFASLLVLLGLISYFLVWLVSNVKLISATKRQNSTILLVSVLTVLLLSELVLRTFAFHLRTHWERNGETSYFSVNRSRYILCEACGNQFFHLNKPNTNRIAEKIEFQIKHSYNSIGFRDTEFSKLKGQNEFRIMGLGDSFTEGVGTTADSTWLKQLNGMLNRSQNKAYNYNTYNCGVSGSDIVREYDLFSKCLINYKPDLLIINLNSSDIADIILRGGEIEMDEFGNSKMNKRPWFEYFFGSSFLVRAILLDLLNYNWTLLSPNQQAKARKEALRIIEYKLYRFQDLAKLHNFELLLILQPFIYEFEQNQFELSELNSLRGIKTINLFEEFNHRTNRNIKLVKAMYWPIDMHYTTLGNKFAAEAIYENYFANSGEVVSSK